MGAIYKVSYVVIGENHPGAILNVDRRPVIGDHVQLGEREFVVVEVLDLMPARGDFHFLHATLQATPP
jgi:hypothetical protein